MYIHTYSTGSVSFRANVARKIGIFEIRSNCCRASKSFYFRCILKTLQAAPYKLAGGLRPPNPPDIGYEFDFSGLQHLDPYELTPTPPGYKL